MFETHVHEFPQHVIGQHGLGIGESSRDVEVAVLVGGVADQQHTVRRTSQAPAVQRDRWEGSGPRDDGVDELDRNVMRMIVTTIGTHDESATRCERSGQHERRFDDVGRKVERRRGSPTEIGHAVRAVRY